MRPSKPWVKKTRNFNWFRPWTRGGLLRRQQWANEIHETWKVHWLLQLQASQEKLYGAITAAFILIHTLRYLNDWTAYSWGVTKCLTGLFEKLTRQGKMRPRELRQEIHSLYIYIYIYKAIVLWLLPNSFSTILAFLISDIKKKIKYTLKFACSTLSQLTNPYNNNSMALVRERTIPTERPPLVGEVNANFWG
jgi:hypothetical protein